MTQEKQFCRNCGKRDEQVLKGFWEPGLCMDCHRLPVIGIRYDVFTGELIVPKPATKHDGKLDTDGHLKVYLFKGPYASHMGIENSHRDTGDEEVLNPKQALSLLAWLRQEEETLRLLAKEQAE